MFVKTELQVGVVPTCGPRERPEVIVTSVPLQICDPGDPEYVPPWQSLTVMPLMVTLPVLQTLNASLTDT